MGNDNGNTDDDEDTGPIDIRRDADWDRANRQRQVSYQWCKTIRTAGELYRHTHDIDDVASQLQISRDDVREALTVYRLIFEEPVTHVAALALPKGQKFFSLIHESDDVLDDPPDDFEYCIREYVGSVYLQHNIGNEDVGDPPENKIPPSSEVFKDIAEAAVSKPIPLPKFEPITLPEFEPITLPKIEIPDFSKQLESQQKMMQEMAYRALQDMMTEVDFPKPLFADLAAVQASTTARSQQGYASVDDFSLADPGFADRKDMLADPDPVEATVDSTLPDSDAVSSELLFEIPAQFAETMLGAGQAREWFLLLSEDDQELLIGTIMFSVAVGLTQSPFATVAFYFAPAVRRHIVERDGS